jgi:hypothetical protein
MEASATAQDTEDLTDAVDHASLELRAAVIAADHARAERAVSDYLEALRQIWEVLSEQERAVSTIPTTAHELLAWARQMTLIQRNLAADQYAILQKTSRYYGAVSQHARTQFNG